MENDGDRSITTYHHDHDDNMPLDVRETRSDPLLHRLGSLRGGEGPSHPPEAPPRPHGPVRVHSRPRMPIITPPPPQTSALLPITSSGPIRTHDPNLARSNARGRPVATSSMLRRNISDFATVTIGRNDSVSSSSSGRLENNQTTSPVLGLRTQSLSNSRLQSSRPSGSDGQVSLTLPRPDMERCANEYVETPIRCAKQLPKTEAISHRTNIRSHHESHRSVITLPVTNIQRPQSDSKHGISLRHKSEDAITSQPSATFKKDHFEAACLREKDSIICSECGGCKCSSCRTPRPLPSRWLCGDTCYCSADNVVDYVSCVCCVKAMSYHCRNSDDAEDDICSCHPEGRAIRWTSLTLLSLVLPCLLCYWPCKAVKRGCESFYNYCNYKGCTCIEQSSPVTPEKRLLDSPE